MGCASAVSLWWCRLSRVARCWLAETAAPLELMAMARAAVFPAGWLLRLCRADGSSLTAHGLLKSLCSCRCPAASLPAVLVSATPRQPEMNQAF